jgi:ribose/xylose/arabinose/galactoside ABC-type transport system permease subunit
LPTTVVPHHRSNQSSWPTYMPQIVIGIVIILAVAVDRLQPRRMA